MLGWSFQREDFEWRGGKEQESSLFTGKRRDGVCLKALVWQSQTRLARKGTNRTSKETLKTTLQHLIVA